MYHYTSFTTHSSLPGLFHRFKNSSYLETYVTDISRASNVLDRKNTRLNLVTEQLVLEFCNIIYKLSEFKLIVYYD